MRAAYICRLFCWIIHSSTLRAGLRTGFTAAHYGCLTRWPARMVRYRYGSPLLPPDATFCCQRVVSGHILYGSFVADTHLRAVYHTTAGYCYLSLHTVVHVHAHLPVTTLRRCWRLPFMRLPRRATLSPTVPAAGSIGPALRLTYYLQFPSSTVVTTPALRIRFLITH